MKALTVTAQKWLVGLLGLGLFASVLSVGYVDARRQAQVRQQVEARAEAKDRARHNPKLQKGRELFEQFSCVACHGADGKGGIANFNAQTGQKVPAVEFIQESFTKAELKEKIRSGVSDVERKIPDGPKPPLYMPAYKDLMTDGDMDLLVDYMMSLMPAGEKESW